MADRPSAVYKYEGFNINSLLNLKSQSLYFGSPFGFNDPYDCAITATVATPSSEKVKAVRQHLLDDASRPLDQKQQLDSMPFEDLKQQIITGANKGLNDARENFLNTKGVTCFSELNDDLIMWAHYGGQYKGFCLEFDTSFPPFTKLHKVQYLEEMPQIDIVEVTMNNNYDKLLETLFCTKSISWEYEKEWRAIHAEAGTSFAYEADALKAIYFGPDIEKQALEIICLIIQAQNPNVAFFEGKRSKTEFKVEFSSFTYTSFIDAKNTGLL